MIGDMILGLENVEKSEEMKKVIIFIVSCKEMIQIEILIGYFPLFNTNRNSIKSDSKNTKLFASNSSYKIPRIHHIAKFFKVFTILLGYKISRVEKNIRYLIYIETSLFEDKMVTLRFDKWPLTRKRIY